MWQGLSRALEALRAAETSDRFQHIMLLTDGETEDKADIMGHLRDYKQRYNQLPGTISCFGFGYEIDSPLLVEIASFSDGSYAFIPDAGFVGTVFVNSMSNLLATVARDARLSLQAKSGAEIKEIMAWDSETTADGVASVNLGSLQCGQTRDVVLKMSAKSATEPYLVVSLEYSTLQGRRQVMKEAMSAEHTKEGSARVERHRCRSLFVAALKEVSSVAKPGTDAAVAAGKAVVMSTGMQVQASPSASESAVVALLEDILGQSNEALSRTDYWTKWGRHYVPSVMLAHKLEQCNNFKDPGVQSYGGALFNELRDMADSAFDKLPAPKVTPAQYRYMGNGLVVPNPDYQHLGGGGGPAGAGRVTAAAPAPQVSMAAYNDRYGGCIDGASEALLASGELRHVSELVKGDCVAVGDGSVAEVLCAVRTACPDGQAALVELPSGARLTHFHPVWAGGAWRFPAEIGEARECPCEAVYSFALRGAPSLVVGGVRCVALGHGLREGAAEHAYFGSEAVLRDLAALPGYEQGLVELAPGCVVRDPETGIVCGLRAEPRGPVPAA